MTTARPQPHTHYVSPACSGSLLDRLHPESGPASFQGEPQSG